MATRIEFRRDTAPNWTTANPVLAAGEPGYESDTRRLKVGDGVTAWTALPYEVNTLGAGATGSRPSATTVGAGAQFYDTTLHKPIWSDGTAWRDATGTAA